MSLSVIVVVALKALRRNAMRTALTALGIIIGVAAVIVMVAIGAGAQASIEGQIRSAGSNIVTVSAGSGGFGPVRQGQGAVTTLTAEDAGAIRREVPGIRYLSPGLNTRSQLVAQASNWNTQVQGVGADLDDGGVGPQGHAARQPGHHRVQHHHGVGRGQQRHRHLAGVERVVGGDGGAGPPELHHGHGEGHAEHDQAHHASDVAGNAPGHG